MDKTNQRSLGLRSSWREGYIEIADRGIIICLGLLVLVLPIAHTTSIREVAIAGAFLLWAGILWLERRWPARQNPLNLPILLFSLAVISSIFFSWNLKDTFDDILGELFKVFALYYLVADRIKRTSAAKRLLLVLFVVSVIFSLYSIWDFLQHGGELGKAVYRAGGLRDPGGGQVAGLIHCMVLAFLIPSLSWWRHPIGKLMLGLTILLNLTGLYLTFTRGAWLACVVQLVFLALVADWRRWVRVAVVAALIGIFLILPANVFFHGEKDLGIRSTLKLFVTADPKTIEQEVGGNGGHRLASYKYALQTIADEPFVPHGWGLYLGKVGNKSSPAENWRYFDPMNSFLAIAYQTGVQGLLAFIFLLFKVWQLNWNRYGALLNSFARWFHLAILAMMVGLAINISVGMFYKDESALLFWLLVGIGVGLSRQEMAAEQNGQVEET